MNKKTPQQLEKMRGLGVILAEILAELEQLVASSVALEEKALEAKAQELLARHQVTSPFQGYEGYPYATCVSINEEVVHGVPDAQLIASGSLVGIDLGVEQDGLMVDSAVTVAFGDISAEDRRLLAVARRALTLGVERAQIGNRVGDIGSAIQSYVEAEGFSVVHALTGHGIGRELHEEPAVPNFGRAGTGAKLEEGMTLCIEPMITAGGPEVVIRPGEWPVVTADHSRSAHVEHTVAITKSGPLVLTRL